jgi:hypothetical protein
MIEEETCTEELDEDAPRPFDQLSDRAKDRARDKYREGDYPGYDWWDYTYEDAVSMGNMIGIYIDHTERKTRGGGTVREPKIHFSGFCGQGDGACFEGNYRFVPDAIQKIQSETNDEELLRIAQELALMQMTRRLLRREYFSATITASGNYSHSGTMNVELNVPYDEDDDDRQTYLAIENEVTQLMRSFADWIYKQLEAEYDYLCSDDCVDERLAEESFDEDGEIV